MKTLQKVFLLIALAFALFLFGTKNANAQTFNLGFQDQTGPQTGTVQLTWNDTDLITNYNLAYGTTAGANTYGAVGIGNTGTYLVQGLNPGTRYYFSLSPVVGNQGLGYLPSSNAVAATKSTGTVQGPVSQATFTTTRGSGPTTDQFQLRATQGPGKGTVTLTWANPMNAYDFDVVYGTQAGGVYQHGAQNIGYQSNNVSISGLTSGWTYFFSVLAENGNDQPVSGFSQPVSIVAP